MTELYSNDAERRIICGMMTNSHRIGEVLNTDLSADDFYSEQHQRIYRLLLDRYTRGLSTDLVDVCEYLLDEGTGDKIDLRYVQTLHGGAYGMESIQAGIVKRYALRRRARTAGRELVGLAEEGNTETLLGAAERLLGGLAGSVVTSTTIDGPAGAASAEERLCARMEGTNDESIPTGMVGIDALIKGWRRGQLSIIAARPSMGKTSLALELMRLLAVRGIGVGLLSLEMTSEQCVDKLISLESGVPTALIEEPQRMRPDELQRVRAAIARYHEWPILIDDRAGRKPEEAASVVRRWQLQCPSLSVVFVDYLQLLRGEGRSVEERTSDVSMRMVGLAKSSRIAVVGLAQLNRACEDRADKRPQMSDLRGSGQLEQDAALTAFLYRPHRYDREADETAAELIVPKWRFGQTGTIRLHFDGDTQRFTSVRSGGWGYDR